MWWKERLCIFAHFDKDNLVDDYVFYYLKCLKKVSSHIVFVTTSKISRDYVLKLREICDLVIIRDNVGYDFASWQAGLNTVANTDRYDEIIICNDSVYGPLYPLEDVFNTMDIGECDFWGMTESYDIEYHIQSYFIVFRKNVLESRAFKDFWNLIKVEPMKRNIIEKYEIGLTQALMRAGFKPAVYAPIGYSLLNFFKINIVSVFKSPVNIININIIKKIIFRLISVFRFNKKELKRLNPTHFYWKDLIVKYKMPFLKIELLRDNPMKLDTSNYEDIIRKHTNYELELLSKHLRRVKSLNMN